ncbi:MAG: LamG domain-containing protein, partial [Candidatus Omnitrophica bacterium]|nr:LamG domain-containing protein [Candidatus Omnitrophota bacterium]
NEFTLAEGKKGKGIVIGDKNASVLYEMKDNFNPQSGTLEFWVKPLNWSGYTKPHVFIRSYYDREGSLSVIIYDGEPYGGIALYEKSSREKKLGAVYSRNDAWKAGQWHHVVVVWRDTEMGLYVDGALRGTMLLEFPMALETMSQYLSVGPIHSWGQEGSTVIDELRIYNRPLTAEEIKTFFQESAP